VAVGPAQRRLLLAVLALEANRLVPVDRLVELTWPESPPRTAVHAIQEGVSRLRRLLADAGPRDGAAEVLRAGSGYLLRTAPDRIDAHRFTALVDQARRAEDDVQRVALLDEALGLWSGPALSGTGAAGEVRHRLCHGLEETRLVVLEDLVDARLRLGDHREALGELTALVAANPLREHLVGQLMRALYRCGRPADALEAYRRIRRQMADELGLEPGPELGQLEVAIMRNDPALHTTAPVGEPAAPLRPGGTPAAVPGPGGTPAAVPGPGGTPAAVPGPGGTPAQLPPAVAGFTGRAGELDRLDRLLAGHAADRSQVMILAVDGTAGVGKTALAVQWAHRVADRFPDGQLYVNLRGYGPDGPVMDPADAVRGLLYGLGTAPSRVPIGQEAQTGLYRTILAGKRMLIVLDNARDADHVRPLLPGAPGCVVLVTSRNRLSGLVTAGAHLLTLDVPTAAEARELLALRLGPDRLAAEPDAVDDIIARAGRLPLALAIVAVRAATYPHFPLRYLAGELGDTQHRLDALATADPTTDIRMVFSWSYKALVDPAARLFRLLGLHPGADISVPAAASLTGLPARQVRPLLTQLSAVHLITEASPGRYTFHDLLRAYAREQALAANVGEHRRTASWCTCSPWFDEPQPNRCRSEPGRAMLSRAGARPRPLGRRHRDGGGRHDGDT
jgi:DNA-binding SARP family transcriptional activator